MNNKFLPIGTVVLLENATKKIMITGYASVSPELEGVVYDYSGCPYPEGFMSYNQVCVFNASQIEVVISNGYSNDEQKEFAKNLEAALQEMK